MKVNWTLRQRWNPHMKHLCKHFSNMCNLCIMICIQASPLQVVLSCYICLNHGVFPTFEQIREADPLFRPPFQSHGHAIDINDVGATCARWKKLQALVTPDMYENGTGLAHKNEIVERQIPYLEEWSSIVYTSHVTSIGKHLSLKNTWQAIKNSWTTQARCSGISPLFVKTCTETCVICSKKNKVQKNKLGWRIRSSYY